MIDIDHFKLINDRHGHAIGDQAIRQVGRHLLSHLRPGDVALRYGGEEFVVLLPRTSAAAAHEAAERLRAQPLVYARDEHGEPLSLTLSIGVTACQQADAVWTQVVARADTALYQAKRTGRNRVVLA